MGKARLRRRLREGTRREMPVTGSAPRARGSSVLSVARLVAALLAVAAPSAAQINIERMRLDARSLGFAGAASVSFTLERGNSERQRGEGQVRLDWLREGTESFAILRGDFDWTTGRRVSNEGLLHLRHIVGREARWSPEVFAQLNYDQARNLDFRALAGAGVRVRLADRSRARVSAGLAYMFEREEWGLPVDAVHPRETSNHRATSFVTASAEPREGLALATTTYVQPRLDAFDDVRVLSRTVLGVQLLGPVSLDVALDLAYDAGPPDGIEGLDASLRTGIGLRF